MKKPAEFNQFIQEFILTSEASTYEMIGLMLDALHIGIPSEHRVSFMAKEHIQKYVILNKTGYPANSIVLETQIMAYYEEVISPFIIKMYPIIREHLLKEQDFWTIDNIDYQTWRSITIDEIMGEFNIDWTYGDDV